MLNVIMLSVVTPKSVLIKPFQPSLILASKARVYPSGAPFRYFPL
jgi:hypothetical protein